MALVAKNKNQHKKNVRRQDRAAGAPRKSKHKSYRYRLQQNGVDPYQAFARKSQTARAHMATKEVTKKKKSKYDHIINTAAILMAVVMVGAVVVSLVGLGG